MQNSEQVKSLVDTFPRNRLATFDIGVMSSDKHSIPALLEIDVTNLRARVKSKKERGVKTSFTAELLSLIGEVIHVHPQVAGYLLNREQTIYFDSVAIAIVVEKGINGKRVPVPFVLRKAHLKSGEEIALEIEQAQNDPMDSDALALRRKQLRLEKFYYILPGLLRRVLWKFIFRNPQKSFETMGNVVFTSVASVGSVNGWFVNSTIHPISFAVSSVVKKPVVHKGEVVIRDIMNMTVVMDHDVVDGIPMAKFIRTLVKRIEMQKVT